MDEKTWGLDVKGEALLNFCTFKLYKLIYILGKTNYR